MWEGAGADQNCSIPVSPTMKCKEWHPKCYNHQILSKNLGWARQQGSIQIVIKGHTEHGCPSLER